MGRKIDERVAIDSPRNMIYRDHFSTQEFGTNHAWKKKDYSWVKLRLRAHKKVPCDDPNVIDGLRPTAPAIYGGLLRVEKRRPVSALECLIVTR